MLLITSRNVIMKNYLARCVMDDSFVVKINKTGNKTPLGMSYFSANDRKINDWNIRLAMTCIEGSTQFHLSLGDNSYEN